MLAISLAVFQRLPEAAHVDMLMAYQRCNGYFLNCGIQAKQGGKPEEPFSQAQKYQYITENSNHYSNLHTPGMVAGK